MAGLTDKQKRILAERAAKEAAERKAREEAAAPSRRRRKDPDMMSGIPGPPPALVAILILLLMIGGAIALGFWLSSASTPSGRAALPDDFGTSEDKGGYVSDEGLPVGSLDEVKENAAAADNIDPSAGEGGEDGDSGADQDTDQEGSAPVGSTDVPEDAVRVHLPAFVTGDVDPGTYAAEHDWMGHEAEADGSAVYIMSAEQREQAVGLAGQELDALLANAASGGVFTGFMVVEGDESRCSFRAFAAEGYESDTESWKTAARDIMSKAAERRALTGANNLSISVSVCTLSPEGVETPVGTVFYTNGELSASLVSGG